jgi:F-type H+-transporting ATPase subunit gamma
MREFQEEFQTMLQHAHVSPEDFQTDSRERIWEPNIPQLLEELSRAFFQYQLYQVLLEAKASEQSSRMVAVKTATDNAETLLKKLNLECNKVRQAAITNEIVELSRSNFGEEE